MKIFLQFFGFLLILAGIFLFISPDLLYDWIVGSLDNKALYIAAIVARLVLGTILLIAASQARFPNTIRYFGAVSIIAAVIFLFLGQEGFIDLWSSWLPVMKPYAWVSGLLSIGLGGFLVYAFMGEKHVDKSV